MATTEEYAKWIVDNQDKQGTPEFEVVSKAYQASKMRKVDLPANGVIPYQDSPAWKKNQEVIDPTEGMTEGEKFAAGMGKAAYDVGRGSKQLAVEGYSPVANLLDPSKREQRKDRIQELRQQQDETARLDSPLMKTGSGMAGNVAGNVAITAPATFIPGVNTITGGALLGTTFGALQPVGVNGSRGNNAALGGVAGGMIPLGVKSFNAGKSALQPFYEKGQKQIIGNVLRRAAGDNIDDSIRNMQNARPLVPGSMPTAGQSSGNAGIASLERTAEAIDPTAYAQVRAAQNQARMSALEGLKGSADDYAAAAKARSVATNPLYTQVSKSDALADPGRTVNLIDRIVKANPKRDALVKTLDNVRNTLFDEYPLTDRGSDAWKAVDGMMSKTMPVNDFNAVRATRTILDRVRKGSIGADDALEQLKAIPKAGKQGMEAVGIAKQYLKTPDYVLTQSPQALKSASQNIGDLINKKGPTGENINEAIVRELTTIKKSLDHQIGKAEPAYKAAQQLYAEKSGPINQMDVARLIAQKSVNPLRENIRPESFAKAISDETARKATGFKRAKIDKIMTPDQMGTLNAIKQDLQQSVFRDTAGRSVGSDTVQKLAYSNMLDTGGVPNFLRNISVGQTFGNLAGRGADALYGRANRELATRLAETLLNPQNAAEAMLLSGPKNSAAARGLLQALQGLSMAPVPLLANPPQ